MIEPTVNKLAMDGFAVVDIPLLDELNELRADIYSVFDLARRSQGNRGVTCDSDITEFYREDQPAQFNALKMCWGLPSLYGLASHPAMIRAATDAGIQFPVLELPPLLRCDMPNAEELRSLPHQDYPTHLGSDNSVTLWIPLQDSGETEGSLRAAPGSHLDGLYPHYQESGIDSNSAIPNEFDFDFVTCAVKFGEALICDQKLVHESGVNTANVIRFAVLIRYSDLHDPAYLARGWPRNYGLRRFAIADPTVPRRNVDKSTGSPV